jgi:eukaryotic-like serine/threonine-protein kinase
MQPQQSGALRCEAYLFDSFEVSIRLRVMRQGGERLKLQELPFQMLLVLLENAGEMVSKEELRRRLWGEERFIEVDKSLYVMARKLREVLGDNATQPRYIQTVSGQGYRFIGQVRPVFTPQAKPGLEIVQPVSPKVAKRSGVRHIVLGSLLAGVVLAAVAGALYRYTHRALAGDQDKVAVGVFINNTGNPDLDRMLSFVVQLKLQESPYLSLIPDGKFRAAVKDVDSPSLKDELHACASLNGQILLKGQLETKAQGYQVLLTAWRCSNGRLLTTQKSAAASQATILAALDIATDRMRRRLGESESSLQKFNVPLVQATTASLAALKAFTLGEEKRSQGEAADSVASYKLAIDLDPQFALAYARLGTIYNNAGQSALSRQYYEKAFELRDRSSDREKLYIVTHYYEYATGEIKRAIEDYELWRTLYPRDLVPTNNLAIDYLMMGEPQKSLELAHRALQLDPSNSLLYGTLAESYLKLGDYANVKLICDNPVYGKMNVMGFHRICYRAAFAQADEAGMQRQMQWAHGNPEESDALDDAAWVAMYRGQMIDARRLFTAAKQNALANNSVESAASALVEEANLEADFGSLPAAHKDAQDALALPFASAFEQAYAALPLASSGDISNAQSLAKKAASMAPLDTMVNSAMLASVRAAIHLQQHDPRQAIQSLEETRPLDFSSYMELAPGYYRGLAYMQNNQPQQAIIEFRRVIDHGALADFPIYVVLSKLELGRALQLTGDQANATRAFSEVAETWKNADPSFPPLQKLHAYQHQSH